MCVCVLWDRHCAVTVSFAGSRCYAAAQGPSRDPAEDVVLFASGDEEVGCRCRLRARPVCRGVPIHNSRARVRRRWAARSQWPRRRGRYARRRGRPPPPGLRRFTRRPPAARRRGRTRTWGVSHCGAMCVRRASLGRQARACMCARNGGVRDCTCLWVQVLPHMHVKQGIQTLSNTSSALKRFSGAACVQTRAAPLFGRVHRCTGAR